MVLTYQEAVEAGARALYAHDRIPGDAAWPEWDALVVGSTGQQWQAIGYRDTARGVLGTIGYADLVNEVENLRITVCEDWRYMDRDAVEIERLRYVESDLASAREAGRSYRRQRNALAATLARVKALAKDSRRHGSATGWHSQVHTVVKLDDLRVALDPKGADDE